MCACKFGWYEEGRWRQPEPIHPSVQSSFLFSGKLEDFSPQFHLDNVWEGKGVVRPTEKGVRNSLTLAFRSCMHRCVCVCSDWSSRQFEKAGDYYSNSEALPWYLGLKFKARQIHATPNEVWVFICTARHQQQRLRQSQWLSCKQTATKIIDVLSYKTVAVPRSIPGNITGPK